MAINKPCLSKTKTFLKKNKLLSYLFFFPILVLGLAITFWAIQLKESIDVKEKEILLIKPSFQKASTQTSHIKQMFRYNPQHTGVSPYIGPAKKPTKEWTFSMKGAAFSSGPSIAQDGTIYVGSVDEALYAVNPDGTLKWKYMLGNSRSTPAISEEDGTIYIGTHDGHLYAINSNGTLKWKYKTAAAVYSSPVIAPDKTIYITSHDNSLYAINPDGIQKWHFLFPVSSSYQNQSASTPSSSSTKLEASQLEASMKDETFDNRIMASAAYRSSPAINKEGIIYVGSDDTHLYAISPKGELIWKYKTGGIIWSSPAIAPDGTIYIGSNDSYVYAVNPNGTLKWKYKTGYSSKVWSSPAIASDGTIYVGVWCEKRLCAINPNGTSKWTRTIDTLVSSIVIDAKENIFIPTHVDSLFAFSSDGKQLWKIYPTRSGDQEGEIALDKCGNIYTTGAKNSAVIGDDLIKWKNPAVQPQNSDLSITKQDNPDPVEIESLLTYTLTITNNGPDTAGQVQATDTLPAQEFYFNSASSSQGTCSHTSGIVTCSLGNMASGTQATITIDGYVYGLPQGKKLTNKAVVGSTTNDPDSSNNQAEEDTWVHEYEDPSPSPSPNCHKADYNNDGKVDPADLAVFLSYWGTSNSSGDFNNDNVVNAADLAIFLSYWGPCP